MVLALTLVPVGLLRLSAAAAAATSDLLGGWVGGGGGGRQGWHQFEGLLRCLVQRLAGISCSKEDLTARLLARLPYVRRNRCTCDTWLDFEPWSNPMAQTYIPNMHTSVQNTHIPIRCKCWQAYADCSLHGAKARTPEQQQQQQQ